MMSYSTWITSALTDLIFIHLFFMLATFKKRNDWADVFWGLGFVIAGFAALYANEFVIGLRGTVALALVSCWGLRLAYYIGGRVLSHSAEDARYKKFRVDWGASWVWKSYLIVWLMQGVLMFIIVQPLIFIIDAKSQSFDFIACLGALIWLAGFLFESIGDHQLRKFKADSANKGRIMDRGLWSWSRHPNYFGEVIQWWGIFLLAAGMPGAWWTIISPLTITFLILKFSGVPMLEKMMEGRPGFSEYKQRTSLFIPWPPKKI